MQIFPSTTERVASHALARVQSGTGAPGAGTHVLGLMNRVLCSTRRSEILGQFNYCWICAMQAYGGPPTPRHSAVLVARIDTDELNARRAAL